MNIWLWVILLFYANIGILVSLIVNIDKDAQGAPLSKIQFLLYSVTWPWWLVKHIIEKRNLN